MWTRKVTGTSDEDRMEAEVSFYVPDRLLREQEGYMVDSIRNCRFCLAVHNNRQLRK